MTEIKKTPIPQRLKNVSSDHPYVAGSIDIVDDVDGRSQQDINADTYRKNETYSQEQLNSMITTPEQQYVNLVAESGDTLADIFDGVTGEADTTYRVGCWDGTQYTTNKFTEYSWNGTDFIPLSIQDYGIDEEPVLGSHRFVESNGIAKTYGHYENNPEYVFVLADKQGKILLCVKKNSDIVIPGGAKNLVGSDVAETLFYAEDKEERKVIVTDSEGRIASMRMKDGSLWEHHVRVDKLSLGGEAKTTIKDIIANEDTSLLNKSYTEVLVNKLTPLEYTVDANGWEVVDSKQMEVFIKKCKLQSKIKWTPKKDLLSNRTLGDFTFLAGQEVEGLPYSGTQEIDKAVGYDVSMETFMSAVNNPYSLLYTECIRSDENQKSSWGKVYHGPSSAGLYYGSVCSTLSSYAVGLGMDYKTYQYGFLTRYGWVFGLVYPEKKIDGIRTGDVVNQSAYTNGSGHCVVISGVKRDNNGNIVAIKVTEELCPASRNIIYEDRQDNDYDDIAKYINDDLEEANTGILDDRTFKCPLNTVTIDDETYYGFADKELLRAKYCNIIRNARFYENEMNDTWDLASEHVYNNDICTFAGNKACFREGEMIVLNYDLDGEHGDWSHIKLFKNEELIETFAIEDIDQSTLPEDQQGHAIILPELGYGCYKACMTDGTEDSGFTYFNVIDTAATGIYDDKTLKVQFSSRNASPVGLRVCSEDGAVRGQYAFNGYDIAAGKANVSKEYLSISGTGFTESTLYLKVYFKDAFGTVTNEPLLINFGNNNDSGGGEPD